MTKPSDLPGLIGQETVSKWIEISQARIDAFADTTEDWQFIHVDPEAASQTPFGGTVAHGFLTLSLMSAMAYDAVPPLDGAGSVPAHPGARGRGPGNLAGHRLFGHGGRGLGHAFHRHAGIPSR